VRDVLRAATASPIEVLVLKGEKQGHWSPEPQNREADGLAWKVMRLKMRNAEYHLPREGVGPAGSTRGGAEPEKGDLKVPEVRIDSQGGED